MISRLPLATLMLLTACAHTTTPVEAVDGGAGKCVVSDPLVKSSVGQPYTSVMGDTLKQRTHAAVIRVVRPGEMVTMDYRADRLTVRLDEQDRVTAISCG